MHETGHSKLVHWDNPERWDGKGGGRGFLDRGHVYMHGWFHVNVWQNPPQYCKVISLQLKLKNKKLNIQKAKKEDLICKVFKEFIQLNIKTIAWFLEMDLELD